MCPFRAMKLLLVFSVLGLASVSSEGPSSYHESIGIPQAKLIKAAEGATDFDGSRIIGGSPTALGKEPYVAGLVITLTTGATSVCGGALVSNSRVLTTASCWWDGRTFARQLVVVLGSTTLFSGGTRITVSSNNILLHENYDTFLMRNNLAIIFLPWIPYTENMRNVALPATTLETDFAGVAARVSGYGQTGHNMAISGNQTLKSVEVRVITNTVCHATYGTALVNSAVLCTSGGHVCAGDTGSPLVTQLDRVDTLIGLVSFWSAAGCQFGFPAGHVRISSLNHWIQSRL